MKKLIIATASWHPQINGVVRTIEEMMPFLKGNEFDITIIHPRLFFSIPMLFYPEIRLSFFIKRKIKNIIEEMRPDYIHIQTEDTIGMAVRKVCAKNNLMFTSSFTTNILEYNKVYFKRIMGPLYPYMHNYFQRKLSWFHRASSAIMVSTETLKKELEKEGYQKVVLSPLGVDTKLFKPADSVAWPEKDALKHPVFVYMGRVAKEKNIEEFLQSDLTGTKLVIGDGPIRKKLEKKYKNAVFVGWKKQEELANWLSRCDVFVFPSKTDTFGLVVIEALACGLPVAAHDVMGPKDIIVNGVDGFLDDDIKKAAVKCLNISKENCRQKALQFSWQASAEAFIKNLVPAHD